MTNLNQAALHEAQAADLPESLLPETNVPETRDATVQFSDLGSEQQYRAGFYSLLAALLRSGPDQTVLDEVKGLAGVEPVDGALTVAMSMLGLAASTSNPEAVEDEHHALFIGLGRGELVPYGSWYQTGFLMEKPLGYLRDDLAALGYQRDADVREPEDHIAALCEVMMFLIGDGVSLERQTQFFEAHMAQWIERFFTDLSEAKAAVFYRAVGRFGLAFAEVEKQYLSMQV